MPPISLDMPQIRLLSPKRTWLMIGISRFSLQLLRNALLFSHRLKISFMYFRERNFRVDLYFLTFRVGLIPWIGCRWIFREDIFLWILVFINVIYILIFSWVVLQLVVCESRIFYQNFSIFPTALFGYIRLNSRLNAWEAI